MNVNGRPNRRSPADVPGDRRPVGACRVEGLPVGAEDRLPDRVRVAAQRLARSQRAGIPDGYRSVAARRHDGLAVRAEQQPDRIRCEGASRLPPLPCARRSAGCRHRGRSLRSPIRAEGERAIPSGISSVLVLSRLSRSHQASLPSGRGGDERAAVGRQRDAGIRPQLGEPPAGEAFRLIREPIGERGGVPDRDPARCPLPRTPRPTSFEPSVVNAMRVASPVRAFICEFLRVPASTSECTPSSRRPPWSSRPGCTQPAPSPTPRTGSPICSKVRESNRPSPSNSRDDGEPSSVGTHRERPTHPHPLEAAVWSAPCRILTTGRARCRSASR